METLIVLVVLWYGCLQVESSNQFLAKSFQHSHNVNGVRYGSHEVTQDVGF